MNKTLSVFLVIFLCLSPTFALLRFPSIESQSNSLNDSIKAVLGSLLHNIDLPTETIDNSSHDDNVDTNISSSEVKSDEISLLDFGQVENVLMEVFGQENKVVEGLIKMVVGSLEDLFDHGNKFIDITSNKTSEDQSGGLLMGSFQDFESFVSKMLDSIVANDVTILEDEYIVSDKEVNKPMTATDKLGEGPEQFGKEENVDVPESMIKNGLKTISFIKQKLGRRNEKPNDHVSIRTERELRRLNALKPEDFERFAREERNINDSDGLLDETLYH